MGGSQFDLPVTQPILTALSRLDEFRGAWSQDAGIPLDRLERIREAARVQSVGASCRLSGIRVSDVEVAGVMSGESVPLRDGPDILGYGRALGFRFPDTSRLIGSDTLLSLHAVLIAGHPEAAETPSDWRAVSLQREAFDATGRATGRVFSTLPPRLVREKVEDLLTWLEFELRTGDCHAVLVIATFVLGILAACPFPSRNGRMARLLVTRLLERAGYAHMPYASVEHQIEEERGAFQEAFDRAQTRFWAGEPQLEPWLEFFVEILDRHRQAIVARADVEREVSDFPPLQRSILELVREHGSADAGMLIKATGANRNTLKDNLRRLVERGVLEKTGQRRGTRYRMPTVDRAHSVVAIERD